MAERPKGDDMSEWIKVGDKLPESGQHCLFVISTSIDWVCAGFADYEECDFRDASICDQYGDDIGYSGDCITHWMPIPEIN